MVGTIAFAVAPGGVLWRKLLHSLGLWWLLWIGLVDSALSEEFTRMLLQTRLAAAFRNTGTGFVTATFLWACLPCRKSGRQASTTLGFMPFCQPCRSCRLVYCGAISLIAPKACSPRYSFTASTSGVCRTSTADHDTHVWSTEAASAGSNRKVEVVRPGLRAGSRPLRSYPRTMRLSPDEHLTASSTRR